MKPSKNQKKILKAMAHLPEEMEPEELEALICSLASSYVGFEEVPRYLLYLHVKTRHLIGPRLAMENMMEESNRETKH
jgi:hypothetical protein